MADELQTVLLTVGLPASGKSTYAKELVATNKKWARVNRDDLRSMVFNGFNRKNEKTIVRSEMTLAELYLSKGINVVVDDTNLNPKVRDSWKTFCDDHGANFKIRVFDTSLRECIRRDVLRQNSVGEDVIRRMWSEYIVGKYEHDHSLPKAIIADVDGTLALMNGRSPYDWDKVDTDLPNKPVINMLRSCLLSEYSDCELFILSGRDSVCREKTEIWLDRHLRLEHTLLMRPMKDTRDDAIVKSEMFDMYIDNQYDVQFVVDDRQKVVDTWREKGLTVFQVADGRF